MQHKTRVRLGITAGVVIGLAVLGSVVGHGSNGPSLNVTPSASTHHDSASPSASASASDTGPQVKITSRIVFRVTGSAPNGATISYGNDHDTRDAGGTAGPLGDATLVPWSASMHSARADYWFVQAQLEGGGDITAKIIQVQVGHFPATGKTMIMGRHVLATAHASGGYQIANAETLG